MKTMNDLNLFRGLTAQPRNKRRNSFVALRRIFPPAVFPEGSGRLPGQCGKLPRLHGNLRHVPASLPDDRGKHRDRRGRVPGHSGKLLHSPGRIPNRPDKLPDAPASFPDGSGKLPEGCGNLNCHEKTQKSQNSSILGGASVLASRCPAQKRLVGTLASPS
jgi:hypothetical protein